MTTQAVITYTATVLNVNALADLEVGIAAVPLPFQYLYSIGVYAVSDVTAPSGDTVVRTITLSLVPGASPTATAAVNDATGTLASLTSTGAGTDVIASPIVEIPGIEDAIIYAPLTVTAVPVTAGGMNYSAQTIIRPISSSGQVNASSGQTFTPNIGVGGVISSVTVAGGLQTGNYVYAPVLEVIDPTGDGSEAVLGTPNASTSIVAPFKYTIISPGQYDPTAGTPAVTFVPRFKYLWPDSIGAVAQAAPFVNLLRAAIVALAATPIAEVVTVS